MKKLLGILGGLLIITPSFTSVVSCTIPNQNINNNSNNTIPEEMYEMNENLENIINGSKNFQDEDDMLNTIVQAELMTRDITSSDIFYSLNNKIGQILSLYSLELQKIPYIDSNGKETNAESVFRETLNQQDILFQEKLNSGHVDLLSKYQDLKTEEANLFFDKYDQKNMKILNSIVEIQNKVNQLNIRNAKIKELIKGLNTQNKIIIKILNILDETTTLIEKTKNIFDNAKNNVVDNYNGALWHNNHWGLGCIPLVGIGFNVAFKDDMDDATDAMQIYTKTFADPSSEGAKAEADMLKNLDNLKKQIDTVDVENNDIVNLVIDAANFNPLIGNVIEKTVDAGLMAVEKAMGPFGPALSEILQILGALFNAYKLHKQFDNFNNNYNKNFLNEMNDNNDLINDAYNQTTNTKNSFSAIFKANNKESQSLINELHDNEKNIENLNNKLNLLNKEKKESDLLITNAINEGMFSDYYYYWNANKIGHITNGVKNNLTNNDSKSIEDIDFEKNELFKEIEKEFANNKLILNDIEYENNVSNKMYSSIINI